MRIGHAVNRYLEAQKALERSDGTIREYMKRLGYFRDHAYSQDVLDIAAVDVDLVRGYHNRLNVRKLAAATRRGFLNTIKDFLSWAHERNLMLSDISGRIELPKIPNTLPPTPLDHDDMLRLLALPDADTPTGKRNRAILEVLYGLGLRRAELLAMNFGDISFEAGTIIVPHGKGDKDRLLPANDLALQSLTDYLTSRRRKLRDTDPVFVTRIGTQNEKRMNENDLSAFFRWLNKRFHKHLHPHLLRHTFACHLLQGGADLRYVQALMGHADPQTTAGYLGLVKEDLKKAYDQAVERILEAG